MPSTLGIGPLTLSVVRLEWILGGIWGLSVLGWLQRRYALHSSALGLGLAYGLLTGGIVGGKGWPIVRDGLLTHPAVWVASPISVTGAAAGMAVVTILLVASNRDSLGSALRMWVPTVLAVEAWSLLAQALNLGDVRLMGLAAVVVAVGWLAVQHAAYSYRRGLAADGLGVLGVAPLLAAQWNPVFSFRWTTWHEVEALMGLAAWLLVGWELWRRRPDEPVNVGGSP